MTSAPLDALADGVARLTARYREIAATAMLGVPICNPRLRVEAVDFRRWNGRAFGVMVTPWFLNLVLFDLVDGESAPLGSTLPLTLPAGQFEFVVGALPGFGRLDTCSLFSPMFEFADMAAAVETAREALKALFAPPQRAAVDRRAFLRGARP